MMHLIRNSFCFYDVVEAMAKHDDHAHASETANLFENFRFLPLLQNAFDFVGDATWTLTTVMKAGRDPWKSCGVAKRGANLPLASS